MTEKHHIEGALRNAIARITRESPTQLAEAIEYAVLSGGGRIRPRLVLAAARASGNTAPELALAAATALELIHCASLVHDDMPVFDDADTRRGKPTVHRVYGEQIALLVGDGLIVEAFGVLARAGAAYPDRLPEMIQILARASGSSEGIVAGQAWESEDHVDVERYHRAKTAALFEAAAELGALASGGDAPSWRPVGFFVGQAYQTADDIMDAVGFAEEAGKPTHQDSAHERPSIVAEAGLGEAVERLDRLVEEAVDAIPPSPAREELAVLLRALATRLCPPHIRERCFLREVGRADNAHRQPSPNFGVATG